MNSPSAHDLEATLSRAKDFLTRQQGPDGAMRGFLLPPGASNMWITAHVALVLEDAYGMHEIGRRAAIYLSASLRTRSAWGFNHRVGADVDSTAQSLMVLHRNGIPVPERALEFILRSQYVDGGFPTYPPQERDTPANGWEAPHPDVTVMVVELLRRLSEHGPERTRAEEWLKLSFVDGVLPCYWWPNDSYAVWAQHRAGLATGGSRAKTIALARTGQSTPWAAMALDAALRSEDAEAIAQDDGIATALTALVEAQLVDGSWTCQPCLRVTHSRCMQSLTAGAPGRLYADGRRTFSTAHAAAALSRIHQEPWVEALMDS